MFLQLSSVLNVSSSSALCGHSQFFPVIPVPFRDLAESHADLLSNADLSRIVPVRVSIEIVKKDLDLLWLLAHTTAVL